MSTFIFMQKNCVNSRFSLEKNKAYTVGQLFPDADGGESHKLTEADAAQVVAAHGAIYIKRAIDYRSREWQKGERFEEVRRDETTKLRAEYDQTAAREWAELKKRESDKIDPNSAAGRSEKLLVA